MTPIVAVQPDVPVRCQPYPCRRDATTEAVVIAAHRVLQNLRCRESLEQGDGHNEFVGDGPVMLDGATTSGCRAGHANQTEVNESCRPVRHDIELRPDVQGRIFEADVRTDELRQVTRDVIFDEQCRNFRIGDLEPA